MDGSWWCDIRGALREEGNMCRTTSKWVGVFAAARNIARTTLAVSLAFVVACQVGPADVPEGHPSVSLPQPSQIQAWIPSDDGSSYGGLDERGIEAVRLSVARPRSQEDPIVIADDSGRQVWMQGDGKIEGDADLLPIVRAFLTDLADQNPVPYERASNKAACSCTPGCACGPKRDCALEFGLCVGGSIFALWLLPACFHMRDLCESDCIEACPVSIQQAR